ncbi:MAG: acetate--CoA ligase family protein [Proteobacteria bacterium]|nr:acetate--CoA ligase family protein [Pseudomonadota bacterium]
MMLFSKEQTRKINRIFETAHQSGRNVLFEHEVYGILDIAGLAIPRFKFVHNPDELDDSCLNHFGRHVVVKIVSKEIVHKQKSGGVRKVRNEDVRYIRFTMKEMERTVIDHYKNGEKPSIEGFLIAEYFPHTQALGNEVFIGIKEDTAFGPVVMMSKGGNDAEFFSRYYDPANLFLPPFDYAYALEMVNTLNIRHKFEENGHPEYLEYYAKAMSILSYLAYQYSFVAEAKPAYLIRSMDINPFIITEDNRFVAIDGFAEFMPYSENTKTVPEIKLKNLEGFFKPSGIAIAGVSKNLEKINLGRDIAQLLHDMGRDDLYLLNPGGGEILIGDKAYTLFENLNACLKTGKKSVDLLVYAAPQHYLIDFIKSLPAKNAPKAVILIPGIPSGMNYREFEHSIDAVKPPDLRIIGPNCMGVYFAPEGRSRGLNTLFIEEERLEIRHSRFSNALLLTQSGAFSVTALDKFQHSRLFKAVVSFGNKYDVKITDFMVYFSKNRHIDVISLYIEGLDCGEGRQFFQIAGKIKKPVIVYKAGKTDAGAKAAASHTASMSGSYDVFRAACLQAGMILVENIEDHYNFVQIFSLLHRRKPVNNKVAGVVNAGFESTVGADELINLEQAELNEKTVRRLKKINTFGLVDTGSPFLDISPMADDRMYADFVEAILQDENVGSVFVAIVPHTVTLKTSPELCHDRDGLANLLVELSRKYDKPMVISVNGGQHYLEFISILEEQGLPVYNNIRSAIKSLDRFVTYHVV